MYSLLWDWLFEETFIFAIELEKKSRVFKTSFTYRIFNLFLILKMFSFCALVVLFNLLKLISNRFISFFRIQGRSRSTTSKWEKIDLSCAVSITICKIWRKDVNLEWETFFVMLSNSNFLGTLQQILTKIWYGN